MTKARFLFILFLGCAACVYGKYAQGMFPSEEHQKEKSSEKASQKSSRRSFMKFIQDNASRFPDFRGAPDSKVYQISLEKVKDQASWERSKGSLVKTLKDLVQFFNQMCEGIVRTQEDFDIEAVYKKTMQSHVMFAQEEFFDPFLKTLGRLNIGNIRQEEAYGLVPIDEATLLGYIKEKERYLVFFPPLRDSYSFNPIAYGENGMGVQYTPVIKGRTFILSPGLFVERNEEYLYLQQYHGNQEPTPLRTSLASLFVPNTAPLYSFLQTALEMEGVGSTFIPFPQEEEEVELLELALLFDASKDEGKEQGSSNAEKNFQLLEKCGYFREEKPENKMPVYFLEKIFNDSDESDSLKDLSQASAFHNLHKKDTLERTQKEEALSPLEKREPSVQAALCLEEDGKFSSFEDVLKTTCEQKKTEILHRYEALIQEERKMSETKVFKKLHEKMQKKKKDHSKAESCEESSVYSEKSKTLSDIKRQAELRFLQDLKDAKLKYRSLLTLLNEVKRMVMKKMGVQDFESLSFQQKGSHIVVHTKGSEPVAPFTLLHKHGRDPLYHGKEVKGLVFNLIEAMVENLRSSSMGILQADEAED